MHDGTAAGERIGAGARRRGDKYAVCNIMIEHQAVHMDVPAHHGKRGFAPHHDIVQRRDLLVVPLRTNHQPPLDGVISAEQALNGLAQLTCLHFGQKTQLAEIAALEQDVMDAIEAQNITVQYEFNYTAIVSGFSAKVPYGRIGDIEAIDGVTRVVLCDTYYPDVVGSSMLGQALSGAEIAAYANHTDYQGAGILIGILDTGLDVAHEAFANAPAVQKLQKSTLEKLLYTTEEVDGKINVTAYSYAALWYAQKNSTSTELKLLTADDLYKSGKVPFAFDYADVDTDVTPSQTAVEKYGNDHGTHVAGIAAGKTVDADGNVTFAGQSPEAQLAIFKVFSDTTNGASTQNILAALNDALLLDVDVINMSLGSVGGFASEEQRGGQVLRSGQIRRHSAGLLRRQRLFLLARRYLRRLCLRVRPGHRYHQLRVLL